MNNPIILAVDIGNTHTTIGLLKMGQVLSHWRLSTHIYRTADEYFLIFKQFISDTGYSRHDISGTALSCVVPPVLSAIREGLAIFLGSSPFIVQPGIRLPLHIRYSKPENVGADRIVNACAGIELFSAPLIIVDFGTATTFCAINSEHEYLGGAIFPGITTTSEALSRAAALLPQVEFHPVTDAIGCSTTQSIQSGLFFGYISLVDGIVQKFKQELQEPAEVIATGGIGNLIVQHTKSIRIFEPFLTLKGLALLFQINTSSRNNVYVWPSSHA